MIKSMTGFARAEVQDGERKFTVEIKAVNHRYLDFNFKMPKKLGGFEVAIRSLLKKYMQRGKVDVFVTYEDNQSRRVTVQYNREMAAQYLQHFARIQEEFGLEHSLKASELARYPEVLTMEEQPADEQELWGAFSQALHQAAEEFAASRTSEGESLCRDITGKLQGMDDMITQIETRAPQIIKEYREKIGNKVKELLTDVQLEESRIAAEVVLFADKICTDEETVRLRSHIENMKHVLTESQGVGRKMDFIAQEMNREANTILSKANDLAVTNVAINLKTEIEKIREQIQNIE